MPTLPEPQRCHPVCAGGPEQTGRPGRIERVTSSRPTRTGPRRSWPSVLAASFVIATSSGTPDASQTAAGATRDVTIDRAQLLEDVRVLSADDMQGREQGTEGSARARAYLLRRFQETGIRPVGDRYEWPFETTRSAASRVSRPGVNVVGLVAGTRAPERYIVVSAHYDHLGVRNGQVFNGADDNASGAAALVTIGAHFVRSRPAHSVLLVAFDAEEADLAGSKAFVLSPPVPRDAMLLNLNADMIARDAGGVLFVAGTRTQPTLRPIVDQVTGRAPVMLRVGHDDPSRPGDNWTEQSDQWSFIQAGIPGLYIGVSDEAHHHRPSDDYETLTHDFYVRAVQTVIQLVEAFDAQPAVLEPRGRQPARSGAR